MHFSIADVKRAYSAPKNQLDWERRDDPWAFYAPAAIEKRQQRWAAEDARSDEDEREGEDDFPGEMAEPHVRAAPKVGRNDPCPCGSSKKYKKCCLLKNKLQDATPQDRDLGH